MKKWMGLWLVAMVVACGGKSSNSDKKGGSTSATTGGNGNPNIIVAPGDPSSKTGPASRFIGRVNTTAIGTLMSWPGTAYMAAFKGGSEYKVVFEAVNSTNANTVAVFDAFVDGNLAQNIRVVGMPGPQEFSIPVGGSGEHTVLMIKRNDARNGEAYFKSGTAVGGSESKLPAPPNRIVEFVGDAYVSGAGNLGTDPAATCSSDPNFQNSVVAFPVITAQKLGVDWSVVSDYLVGLAKDLGGNAGPSDWISTNIYPNVSFRRGVAYDFATPANVVVVMLASDYIVSAFKDKKIPEQGLMVEAYTRLLNQIIEKNPAAFVILATPPNFLDNSPNGLPVWSSYRTMLETVVQGMNNPKISIHNFSGVTAFVGCDYYPDVNAHVSMAQSLADYIKSLTKW
jgi:hypothetical protein